MTVSSEYVYLVTYEKADRPRQVFINKKHAIDSLPESKKNYPCQLSKTKWAYGSRQGSKVFVEALKVMDANGLPPVY